ncbi:putative iron-sulfur cluster-binding rieske family domain protein [Phaeomoniella chlamydospora]|uniref:xyloglucan-specific endo-beta-1,4-glucanase n=1 Tax=Phaeomoniella chlamydospora TaxID=158046 RepID=A0A0G2F4T7_PHACM|nr:putative iron-sulfur cluster-binding rieske family domain protein [Phaeomoniella chlamydospora]
MPSLLSSALLAVLALAPTTFSLPALLSRATTYPASTHCGDYDYVNLIGYPWIVYNMLYNSASTVGTQCTNYDSITTLSSGNQAVVWSSVTSIDYVESTSNVPKGYSFVGLTTNLEVQLSSISSIPASYTWTRTNTTEFKGNICFDFMTSDTKGDSTSTAAEEHMLWLQYEGGQLPIGYSSGPVATIDSLYGTSWKLYSGQNTDTGIVVRSLLPVTQFDGSFDGDIKDWLDALKDLGAFDDSTYVNVGNAGTEMFYGDAVMNATLGLQIDLGTDEDVYSADDTAAITTSASSAAAAAAAAAAAVAAQQYKQQQKQQQQYSQIETTNLS